MCLKVMGQLENDMVLGTGQYKAGIRATMFAFEDKGVFYFAGEGLRPRHHARPEHRRADARRSSSRGRG